MAQNPHYPYMTAIPRQVLTSWHETMTPHRKVIEYTCDISQAGRRILPDHFPLRHIVGTNVCTWIIDILIDDTKYLRHIALLSAQNHNYFKISWVKNYSFQHGYNIGTTNTVEWHITDEESSREFYLASRKSYRVKINFESKENGTYWQNLIFHFGEFPVSLLRICVVKASKGYEKEMDVTFSDILSSHFIDKIPCLWNCNKLHNFSSPRTDDIFDEMVVNLSKIYPRLSREKFIHTYYSDITVLNYRDRLHDLINIEKRARNLLASPGLQSVELNIIPRFLLWNDSVSLFMRHIPGEGERLARFDTIRNGETTTVVELNRCILLIQLPEHTQFNDAFEALIERQTFQYVYIRISPECVNKLNLPELYLEQNRLINVRMQYVEDSRDFCYWHWAIDRLRDTNIVLPQNFNKVENPIKRDVNFWKMIHQQKLADKQFNSRQKLAIYSILKQYINIPNLLVGPFGTGKTFVIAHALRLLLTSQKGSEYKILLCTQNNSAADVYITEYFNGFYEKIGEVGFQWKERLKPLRLYKKGYDIKKVDPTVLKYCRRENDSKNAEIVEDPSVYEKYNLIVTTVDTLVYLMKANLQLTHIVIDEATQITECETLMAITTANQNVYLTLAGDLARSDQGRIKSTLAKQNGLHKSLLHRLVDVYPQIANDDITDNLPSPFPYHLILKENCYTTGSIINFIETHYRQGSEIQNIPVVNTYEPFNPLIFCNVRGTEKQVRRILKDVSIENRTV